MATKYTNIFHCKTLQNLPTLGFLVSKYAIWQPRYIYTCVHVLLGFPNLKVIGNASESGLPDFVDKIYRNVEKYTKLPQNIPNGHKIYQMPVK
jgi:hypothetical protein